MGVGRVFLPVREYLAWVQAICGSECVADQYHGRHVVSGENQGHLLFLLQADAVLAGQRSTGVHAYLQHRGPGFNDLVQGAGLALIE